MNISFKKYIKIARKDGFMAVIKQAGWKVGILIFLFFLIKGLMWLLLPYLFATEFFI